MFSKIVVVYREAPTDKSDWWELHEPFEEILSDGSSVLVNAGYVTDFASVPRWLWSLFPPIGKYNRAALVHDYLYDLQYRQKELGEKAARKFADDQFLYLANKVNDENKFTNYVMYLMVRLFGKYAWRKAK
ncbi:DUF1353 domain-containing protein [Arcicella aquatica]|uniref:DUF1353 domain-containing protein n=1 Tax=Arcicella aquatica TaxID=217141 RepID=A0ABU5QQT2_9BACT|nr:DUF1353 domain-containing protein [Arcicella aquatica]MEA5259452.1 DUF1353 domain-containing protein [Arcicella aquatica]